MRTVTISFVVETEAREAYKRRKWWETLLFRPRKFIGYLTIARIHLADSTDDYIQELYIVLTQTGVQWVVYEIDKETKSYYLMSLDVYPGRILIEKGTKVLRLHARAAYTDLMEIQHEPE